MYELDVLLVLSLSSLTRTERKDSCHSSSFKLFSDFVRFSFTDVYDVHGKEYNQWN